MHVAMLIIFIAVAALFIALAMPLIRNRVPPNNLYGFRTTITLGDPAIWYPVNRVAGLWLAADGVLVAIAATACYLAPLTPNTASIVNLAVVMLGVLAACVHGLIVQKRLVKARDNAAPR